MNISHTEFSRNIGVAQVPIAQAIELDSTKPVPYRFGPFTEFALARDKRPFQANWNKNLLSGKAIAISLERSSQANGIIGIIPDGYAVLDFDGPRAWDCFWLKRGMAPADVYPASTIWYSGNPRNGGLPKIIYRLPEDLKFPGKKLIERHWDGNAVEILGPGHQVTLPGSFHSHERGWYQEDGRYPIAHLPECVIELIRTKVEQRREQFNVPHLRDVAERDRTVEKLLELLDPDDYDTWIQAGLALRALGDEFYDVWDQWSSTGNTYQGERETEKRWAGFDPRIQNGYRYLCRLAGVKPPKQSEININIDAYDSRVDRAVKNWVPLVASQGDDRQFFGQKLADTVSDALNLGDRQLIVQAGTTGCGKSTSLEKTVAVAKQHESSIIEITPLESSAKGLATRSQVPYRKENFNGGDSFSACTNSLIPDAQNANWAKITQDAGGVLALDEASETNQIIAGLRADARLKRQTAQLLLSTRQITIAQSATLKPYDIEFYKHLGGFSDEQVVIDAIAFAPHPRTIEIYHQRQGDVDPKPGLLLEAINTAATGQDTHTAVVITTNSQKLNSRWGTMVLEMMVKDKADHVPVTRIDSQTTKDPQHIAHAIVNQSDVTINAGDCWVVSPSCETNISIHAGNGVSKILWVTLDTGNKTVERLIQDCRARGRDGLDISQKIAIGDHIGRLPHGNAFTADEVLADIQLQISNGAARKFHRMMEGEELNLTEPIFQDYCKRAADLACSLIGKSKILPTVLETQGHWVSMAVCEQSAEVMQFIAELEVCRELAIALWNQTIADAKILSKLDVEALEMSGCYSQEEWYAIRRYKIERVLGNQLDERVENGAIVRWDGGVELTPNLVDAVDRKRLITGWRRTFDIYTTPYDWFLKSVRRLDGEIPSVIESAGSTFAQFTTLEELGILHFVRKYAIQDTLPNIDYRTFLWQKKPSLAFQDAMVKKFRDQAFSCKNPEIQEIAHRLSESGTVESITALLGIRGITRNERGIVTAGSVLAIIRRFFDIRTYRSKSVRVDGDNGATIISLDDRSHELYEVLLEADKLDPIERSELVVAVEDAIAMVTRSKMFGIWEEHRKLCGARILDNVPLLQIMQDISSGNTGTVPGQTVRAWISGLGMFVDWSLTPGTVVLVGEDEELWTILSVLGAVAEAINSISGIVRAIALPFLRREERQLAFV